jgi:hypothetical protein
LAAAAAAEQILQAAAVLVDTAQVHLLRLRVESH